MSGKLALVVDDSKSARMVLRRMLEKHDISVDTAESASDAFDYLDRRRPDVIFMDHMMPGVDGFEAIKRIKADPRTVTIPVMMYTSKGGDLYLGQARALGAVGILPKTVAPAELYDALLRLGLTEERRKHDEAASEEDNASERSTDLHKRSTDNWTMLDEPMPVRSVTNNAEDDHLRLLLEEQRVELRKDLLVSIDSVTRNISSRLNQDIDEKLVDLRASMPKPPALGVPLAILSILFLLLLIWNLGLQKNITRLVEAVESQSKTALKTDTPKIDSATAQQLSQTEEKQNSAWQTVQWALNNWLDYPFDELALDNERLNTVSDLIDRLEASGFRGRVILETHAGEFCMIGSTEKGFELAPADATIDKCDYIGNPVQPTDLPSAHQSLQFANYLNELQSENTTIEVNVIALPRTSVISPYPDKTSETTANSWNQAAHLNNRVMVRLEPLESD